MQRHFLFFLVNQRLSTCKKLKSTRMDVLECRNVPAKFCVNRRVTSELQDDTCRRYDDLVKLNFPSSKKIMQAKVMLFWDLQLFSVL
jgi:hypothetical protein